jgi:tripartite-type tricarboxylate transporter receptor subunit TctC
MQGSIMTSLLQILVLGFIVFAGGLQPAAAQQYPTKPIRIVVSFPPGSSIDLAARSIGQKVSENIGQQMLVDNRAGGNTITSAEVVKSSPPDGYTIFIALDTTLTVIPSLYASVPYDPVRDFTPITQVLHSSYGYFTGAKSPYKTLGELVAYAKANPGKLNIGASTVLTQVFTIMLRSSAGVDVTYVPYKGTPPMVQALLAGEVDVVIDAVPIYLPHIRSGKMNVLATSASTRAVQLPEVPTVREAGYPQLEASGWVGLFGPAGLPAPIVARLNTEFTKVLNDPVFKKSMLDSGQNPLLSSTPEQLAAFVKEGRARWAPIIKAAGIKLD